MWMEFQGKKATHDFLSLHTKDSSFQNQDSRPPPQGIFLKTHDFLKPLEKSEEAGGGVGPSGRVVGPTAERVAHVLPGTIGTYNIGHVAGGGSVKPEGFTCSPNGPHLMGGKPEPDSVGGGFGSCAGVAFTIWESNDNRTNRGGQWPPAVAARPATSFASLSSSRNQPEHDKKRMMESGSRSSRFFDDEEDEDDGFSRRETHKGELTMKADGKGGNDQRATTPRSKHSATEQRRRSKINDRFQILRDLIPHSDQKRDKASFLLEAIEYIRFLQEKVHKYESSYSGWNEENAKLMPWSSGHVPGGNVAEPSQIMKNGASEFIFSGKFDDNSMPVATAMLSSAQNPVESDLNAGVSYKAMENSTGFTKNVAVAPIPLQPCSYASFERGTGVAQPQPGLISDIDNLASQSQSQWLRPSCPADCSVSSDLLNGQEELTIDEGTINVSTAYSQNLLNTLNQALESSGIDLSQANVSVHINLGKKATSRGPAAAATMCSAKDLDNPSSGNQGVMGHSRVGSSGEESERGTKRRKPDS